MPFGWFGIEYIKENNNNKEENPTFSEPNDISETLQEPIIEQKPVIEQKPEVKQESVIKLLSQHKPERNSQPSKVYSPSWTSTTQTEIPVVLLAPSQDLALDYICSMKNNAEDIFIKNGLSFYSNDMQTTSVVIKRKMDIDSCFYGSEDITLPSVYTDEDCVMYEFIIGISGIQEASFKLEINCVTPNSNGLMDKIKSSAAVWMLSDGNEGSDFYDTTVCNIATSDECKDIPTFILLSGFENMYHFKGFDEGAKLDNKDREALIANCREKYSYVFDMCSCNAKILITQIYGGLEIKSKNFEGIWELGLCKNTSFRSYTPIGCHMPVYYTMEAIKNASGGFFDTPTGSMIWQQFRQCFDSYLSAKQWKTQPVVKEV